MIIQIEASDTPSLQQAQQRLQELAASWGHEVTYTPAATPTARTDGKAINPVAIASLAASLPSAALAVADLADRIRKRHRAAELIDCARQQADRQVTITVITPGHITELSTLTPDQLLDLRADEHRQLSAKTVPPADLPLTRSMLPSPGSATCTDATGKCTRCTQNQRVCRRSVPRAVPRRRLREDVRGSWPTASACCLVR